MRGRPVDEPPSSRRVRRGPRKIAGEQAMTNPHLNRRHGAVSHAAADAARVSRSRTGSRSGPPASLIAGMTVSPARTITVTSGNREDYLRRPALH
jgi:hypothetical protein